MLEKKSYCCEMMKINAEFNCDLHLDKYECPDTLIDHNMESDYYSIIIHDGGTSGIEIKFCPWCGTKLSK